MKGIFTVVDEASMLVGIKASRAAKLFGKGSLQLAGRTTLVGAMSYAVTYEGKLGLPWSVTLLLSLGAGVAVAKVGSRYVFTDGTGKVLLKADADEVDALRVGFDQDGINRLNHDKTVVGRMGTGKTGYDYLDEQLGGLKDKVEVKQYHSAETVNDWWKNEMKYDNPPYKSKTVVQEIELLEETTFARFYDGNVSGQYGGWVMRAEDVEGLIPAQIQDNFSLPSVPEYKTDVTLPRGRRIRTGEVNPLDGRGNGGGIQYDLMGQRVGAFENPRHID